MLLATGLAAHVPAAAAAALGLAALTAVLCCLWLRGSLAAVALAAIPMLGVPWPLTAIGLALTSLGSLLLVVAGLTITQLTQQMLAAQGSALQHIGEREDLVRRSRAEQADLTTRLRQVAISDPLTGVLHRLALLRQLDVLLQTGSPVGVLVLSLNKFSAVNDTFGPEVGDHLLAAVAERLRGSARGGDCLGRLGGDEFGIILPGLEDDGAQAVGSRVQQLLDGPFTIGPHLLEITARSGLAMHSGGPGVTAVELVQMASTAAAVSGPGAGTAVYDPHVQAVAADRLELTQDMRDGLARNEFFLLFQPKVCTRTGRVASVEALVRWQHPSRGLIPPDAFIGLAEENGLIVPLGLRVLSLACTQLRAWSRIAPEVSMAVNISARQLVDPDFVVHVRRVLFSSGVDPRQVILELTESLFVEDESAAAAVLWQLRGLGVRMSLDDFGTGYSSLARLGTLPLDELKIDKSFVDRIGMAPNDSTALVTAAIAMGHGLGLSVVAEGVETTQQADFLAATHCDLLQGFLLGRPQPAAEVGPLLMQPISAPATLPEPRENDDDHIVVSMLSRRMPGGNV
jgi:diguanylate cyclase (GGDEF)-like protein